MLSENHEVIIGLLAGLVVTGLFRFWLVPKYGLYPHQKSGEGFFYDVLFVFVTILIFAGAFAAGSFIARLIVS